MHNPRHAFVAIVACGLLALGGVACEKSNEEVLREQAQAGGAVCPTGCATPVAGCLIKGNVGPGGKFFILPGDRRYSLAMISPENGERWFCTELEAQASGFKPVPN